MVFLDESKLIAARWLPFMGMGKSASSRDSSPGADTRSQASETPSLEDIMEKGLARESSEEYTQPLKQSNDLQRFYVERSATKLQYRLYRNSGEFLMYADVKLDGMKVDFYLYDPADKNSLYDPERPAFSMTYNSQKTEWALSHFHEEKNLRYSPGRHTASRREAQEVAFAFHSKMEVGDGLNHCMEANIASSLNSSEVGSGSDSDGSQHSSNSAAAAVIHKLVTRQAVWNEEMQTLVLNFRGRQVVPSAKNFQLALADRPNRTVVQHGKIDNDKFALDFRAPMNISQAFALSVSTLFWD
eukprot:TRINITY_DN100877_c0_g1_i1.p1 TRINITY_DN100877_c0_g1~~TRINITY_DN100877_c0_g1_i1.p1  ORF type:complete len:300 (-),score=78.42 TRINITY_DN100877_c0_g1_i1:315-1214(-)